MCIRDRMGSFIATNLRILFYLDTNNRINLSIGLDCVLSLEVKSTTSNLRGNTEVLIVRSKFQDSRFEFIFTNMNLGRTTALSRMQALVRAYEASRMYREVRLRGAIISNKNLMLLPREKVINRYNNVWNLSSDQGNSGTFLITNVRLAWFANVAENLNASLPYIQIKTVKRRESKFGLAVVVEINKASGGYLLGFQTPEIDALLAEAVNLHKLFTEQPIFGVEVDAQLETAATPQLVRKSEDIELTDSEYNEAGAMLAARKYGGGAKGSGDPSEVIFNEDLGLAMERLPRGVTVESLWRIIGGGPSSSK
eukprot:TRINITY_DN19620_c0_g1_i2.p1 TRINITY_DN19620_c0_g1~~TRINITY_DN19620_c0_g1_i2.p1  ORF type:complete len:331 (+),score=56.01 TRINITY_DN19620_c0_g1_i2:64-993(+)